MLVLKNKNKIGDARFWIFADIRYADNFQLILPDSDTDI